MAYIEGFVTAVPTANREAFLEHSGKAASIIREFGASRVTDAWGDDVPDGKVNDFKGAVQAKADETVCFGWMEFPDKSARDAMSEKMMSDPRLRELGDMPFDGMRMIFGGFEPILDEGPGGKAGYVDGFVLPVPSGNRGAYRDMAAKAATVFIDHGALRVVECWGDDVPDGKITDYRRAAHAKESETVIFAWIEWADRAARDHGVQGVMADERMKNPPADMPFDGSRMIYGGFALLSDQGTAER